MSNQPKLIVEHADEIPHRHARAGAAFTGRMAGSASIAGRRMHLRAAGRGNIPVAHGVAEAKTLVLSVTDAHRGSITCRR